uniref:Uncharacterized protein n=1 Tax=Salvator merianae TaxID=96440 RepID=A0A8D0DZC0_SALMN
NIQLFSYLHCLPPSYCWHQKIEITGTGNSNVECQGNANAWQCNDGRCIDATWICDGTRDCEDGSDEKNCVCAKKKVPCRSGKQCIDPWEICDRHKDCDDGSDEGNCPLRMFQCKNSYRCINERYYCDGIAQCPDGSDESNCWVPTADCAVRCDNNTQCVPESFVCDGSPDCADGLDEQNCGKPCSELQFRCKSGQCVSNAFRCDGSSDCKDHSDESDCPVSRLEFCQLDEAKCLESGECILKEWLCDGDADCKDKTDEKVSSPLKDFEIFGMQISLSNCSTGKPRKCRGHEYQCGEVCIPYTLVCNGEPDCQGGLDEGRSCAVPCQKSCHRICYQSPSGPVSKRRMLEYENCAIAASSFK